MKKKDQEGVRNQVGAQAGNYMSRNVQMGSDTAMESMGELLYKAGKVSNVGFDQSKGNLFEYIEAAKLQTNMANHGEFFDKNPVTDLPEVEADMEDIPHRMISECKKMVASLEEDRQNIIMTRKEPLKTL